MANRMQLLTNTPESVEEVATRTGASLDEVRHALKSLVRRNLASCVWPKDADAPMRWQMKVEA